MIAVDLIGLGLELVLEAMLSLMGDILGLL